VPISEDRMITSKSIAGIALRAAELLASGKIDAATASRIGTATQRAQTALHEGKKVDDKSVTELLEAEKMLTHATRG
jgi:hypothetical protein